VPALDSVILQILPEKLEQDSTNNRVFAAEQRSLCRRNVKQVISESQFSKYRYKKRKIKC